MSNAIQFLETLGRNPALIHGFAGSYATTVASLKIDDAQQKALLNHDHAALSDLLSDGPRMLCLICTPDDESEQEVIPDDGDKDGDSIPDDDPSPARE